MLFTLNILSEKNSKIKGDWRGESCGDTRRPLYFLTLSGVFNVCLNLLFVTVFHMGVEGVAIATVISQTAAAVMVIVTLTHARGVCRLEWGRQ